jgi:hypothetical protein
MPMFLKVGDKALIWLYKGYSLLYAKVTKKLSQQYVGLFKVIKLLGRLVYRLEILEH